MADMFHNLLADRGQMTGLGANRPFWIKDNSRAWLVTHGCVDVFLVPQTDGEATGMRRHLFRVPAGEMMFGAAPGLGSPNLGFLAVGTGETRLVEIPWDTLRELVATNEETQQELCDKVDQWVRLWYDRPGTHRSPKEIQSLQPGLSLSLPGGSAAEMWGAPRWIQVLGGDLRLGDRDNVPLPASETPYPICSPSWIESDSGATVHLYTTQELLRSNRLHVGLAMLGPLAVQWLDRDLQKARANEGTRFFEKAQAQRRSVSAAITQLASVLRTGPKDKDADRTEPIPLLAACRLVGRELAIDFKAPPRKEGAEQHRDAIALIANATRVRYRRVVLKGQWWLQNAGPLVAYLARDGRAVALIPSGPKSFDMVDPTDQTRTRVTAETARLLNPVAFTFYRSFPERALVVADVIQFGLFGALPDLLMVLLMGVAGGLLGLLLPVATGLIFDAIIPAAEKAQLLQLTFGLMSATVAMVLFQLTRSVALLRVELRSDSSIQCAVWDRLLSLPAPFFREYTTGDLANRANGINTIRQILSGVVMNSLLSGLFSVFNFVLIFYYSMELALVASALVLLNIGVVLLASLFNLRLQRPLYEIQGKISGLVTQLIGGITKLRVAGAERNAFAVWARSFSRQKHLDLRVGSLFNRLDMFHAAFPIVTSICFFAAMAFWLGQHLSTGQFLAFNAAFGGFLGGMISLSGALISMLDIVPVYERAKPILKTPPEVDEGRVDPGELSGLIEANHVQFAYQADGPLILKDISFTVKPGEFVAIVGPSGSGKSTLFRMLLGFEKPTSGTLYYDRHDLAGLDLQALRRQLGVVLQQTKIIPGSILENIVGSSLLTIDDAWDAAAKTGLKKDIEEMPMGMHTFLSEGAGTLSGGQRQRLIIARAIVSRPRILLFDEATSALDNRTQAIVSQSLEKLQATRIVIAHRLSTIIHADRILVLQDGSLVQEGAYEDLINQIGPFAELAKRQMS